MKLLALVACVASLGLVAAGCGGDDAATTSAGEWAEEFCTIVQDWGNELERVGEDLGDVSSLSSESLQDAADDFDAATGDFVERVRDLGAPDTESGDTVDRELDELADTVEAEKDEIQEAVDDAEGLGGVADAIGAIGTSVSAMGTAVQETLEALDSADAAGELETALENAETCDELTR